jgi:osmotically-inducible protein OsmY
VIRQLDWDPEVDASEIGVTAHNHVVTLTGYINSYSGKLAAERAAKRVRGVRGVANDLEVRLKLERVDTDIAADVVRALELRSTIPETVQASVHNGHVTLTGTVNWLFQKREAEKALRHIRGVRGVIDHLHIAPRPIEGDIHRRIEEALERNANVRGRDIQVLIEGSRVILSGVVRTWLERESAERAAGDAPGITEVMNMIAVESHPGDVDEIC